MLPFICEGHFHLFEKSNPSFEKMIPVEGHKSLFRDEETNAIVNTDTIAYENYINNKLTNSDKKAEMDDVKRELAELKSLLKELASKITS